MRPLCNGLLNCRVLIEGDAAPQRGLLRAERIMQLTDVLRGRETTTVCDLANELGVSRRTLLRDRGMPITGEAGPEAAFGSTAIAAWPRSTLRITGARLTATLTRDQETEAVVDAAFACRDRLVASGIELAAYTTGASAADVNDIRIALGYGPFDVWGLSYGTRLALEVERDFPEAVHSLVLDSALPPPVNQVTDRAANAERAFRVLFDGCAADLACAAAYPDLETVFYNLVW